MIDKETREKLLTTAILQRETSIRHKEPKIKSSWKVNDDLYYIRGHEKLIANRHNAPLPVMSGMVDTFLSKINDSINIKYTQKEKSDLHKAEICTDLWRHSSATGFFEQVDRIVKKNSALYGRGIFKIYAQSKPKFKICIESVSPFNFHCEPLGGYNLEEHIFCGQDEIFKTKYELENSDKYIKDEVNRLVAESGKEEKQTYQENDGSQNKIEDNNLYVKDTEYYGEPTYNLTEWCMQYEGQRYYLLFEPRQKICIRCEKWDEMEESNLYPWVSYATHPDQSVFWTKALADDIRPIAIEMRVLLNQTLDNIQKRNWAQRVIDVSTVKDVNAIPWRPDGYIPVSLAPQQSVQGAVTVLETPDTTGASMNLLQLLRNMLGQDTGVTAGAQGVSDSKVVSVYRGNMLEVTDRFRKTGNEYQRAWQELGLRYLWLIKQYCTPKEAIKILGEKAHDFDTDVIKNGNPILDYTVEVASKDLEQEKVLARSKLDALAVVQKLMPMNNKAAGIQILTNGGYTEPQAEILLSNKGEVSAQIEADAYRAIQKIELGKEPKPYFNADTYFLQILTDYAVTKTEDEEIATKILDYAMAHVPIANENMTRKALHLQVGAQDTQVGGVPGVGPQPPGQAQGVIDQSIVPNAPSYNLKSLNNER